MPTGTPQPARGSPVAAALQSTPQPAPGSPLAAAAAPPLPGLGAGGAQTPALDDDAPPGGDAVESVAGGQGPGASVAAVADESVAGLVPIRGAAASPDAAEGGDADVLDSARRQGGGAEGRVAEEAAGGGPSPADPAGGAMVVELRRELEAL